ncbi:MULTISPECIES: ecdysteroid 22-kinase family protein [unclassified Bradyrhizobium]|uniref:ecdysteroid 22-kinase family protein n=1 Tax=unclassified Bradyrhizobium TaxID=2631580 RepID=UPI00211E72FB|nr:MULTISPECIES: ecdysteroid 22-kinase family protein [unclassified Bradyrhizobium]MDD1532237.1 aminoglycoside phosphotransferase [Bradyrhizobium sp. WBOS8]MDD1583367.1 aminoglycoside phosphotransferase [Bradyrhizobium sp. WBOS4]UUO46433.1 aminoglycoside phosphotransferase [Bradyrhizobium sp. WBOS04]UUO59874.1 aminoglycoside phosphotransferase [Bradyrhizobium sp. WBOS08]
MTSPQLPAVVEPARLTAALRRGGVLDAGAVREVKVLHQRDTLVSHIIRLGLRYVGESAGAPQSLILKTANSAFAEKLANGGRREVEYYTQLTPSMPPGLVPRCFDGHFDEDSLAWHLLLEDLTDSHAIAAAWPLPPSRDQAIAIVTTLARWHAAWWDHPGLGDAVGTFASPEDSAERMETFAGHYDRFADYLGDRLSEERRTLYRRLIDQSDRLSQRYHSRRHLSITHGDAHVWNFLLPRAGVADTVRIFDFDLWNINVPTHDLAYMMAMHWYPERRQALERPLLNLYHGALIEGGITGYTRGALDRDYRWAVLWQITRPVWQWSIDIPPVIWWNNLERVMAAVDDLGCEELL